MVPVNASTILIGAYITLRWSPCQTQARGARPETLTPRRDPRRFARCSTRAASSCSHLSSPCWCASRRSARLPAAILHRGVHAADPVRRFSLSDSSGGTSSDLATHVDCRGGRHLFRFFIGARAATAEDPANRCALARRQR